jgi:tRNA (mo5U34)-methyltransferase
MDYEKLLETLQANSMSDWSSVLDEQLAEYFSSINHGDYPKWMSAIDNLPSIPVSSFDINSDTIIIGSDADCSDQQSQFIKNQLKILMPWRKGPFNLFGVCIDTEWRSNIKWARIKDHIQALDNRMVLDIGCGNGYYGWRMLGCNAKYVVGMDPTLLFYMQFSAIKKYLPDFNIDVIPLGIQALPDIPLNFDTVFSMGVIYHRRDPIEHLSRLMDCLKSGGELVLETLVIESDQMEVLIPDGRYAKMNNVWAIPNTNTLINWVKDAGFHHARIIDVSRTSSEEQRLTEWMQFESLTDFLDKQDRNKTIEGYPAPTRAILLAEKP